MKPKFYYYKVDNRKYKKVCLKCGKHFESYSKNKINCDSCCCEIIREQTNRRVKKYNKKYRHRSSGTGKFLNGNIKPNELYELEAVISEMKYLGLL